ncbi:hypothetical protein B7764_24030 (plasmid) [Pantoea ananatis]|uniref:hypothetical protein n=1 Tax=Pantoea ananas TaxID=553 RepID=UPI000B6109A2|nr:hypothetical protein [Pantoea ananatis]ASN18211.1 hypothetical protein B7764_24030 [Pantoea ananatis]
MSQKPFSVFYFATVDRPIITEPHHFFVSEAKKRLLSQFSDIEGDAKKHYDDALEKAGQHFDPDASYPDDAHFYAYDDMVSHWLSLNDMKNTVTLALTAAMFHQFDKALRDKCVLEFSHWLDHTVINSLLWNVGFPRLIELLEWIGMSITDKAFYRQINACRLVVNVYKHGDGDAHAELSTHYPEYYPQADSVRRRFGPRHEQLEVSEDQFTAFADAITAFWENIPVHCMDTGVGETPEWLVKEFSKHEKKVNKHKTENP